MKNKENVDFAGWERRELVREDLDKLASKLRELDLLITTSEIQDDGELTVAPFDDAIRELYSSFLYTQNEKFVIDKTEAFLRIVDRYFQEKDLLGEGWFKLREKDLTHGFAAQLRGFLMFVSTSAAGKISLQEYYRHNRYVADFALLEKKHGRFMAPSFRESEQRAPSQALMQSLHQMASEFGGTVDSISPLTGRVYRSNAQIVLYIPEASQYMNGAQRRTEEIVAERLIPLLGKPWWKPDSWNSLIDYEFHCVDGGIDHQVFIHDDSYKDMYHQAMKTLRNHPQMQEELDRDLRANILSYNDNNYLLTPAHRLAHRD